MASRTLYLADSRVYFAWMTTDVTREDVSFESGGLRCHGWFYPAVGVEGRAPAVLVSHGFSAVKEHFLDSYATRFAAAGFAVLVFDYRYLGSSEGEPRGRILPHEQHDDIRAALGWLSARDEVDANRIGVWGTSYSGGHALYLAAFDPRIKVVVAQVPAISGVRSILLMAGPEGLAGLLELFVQDHAVRNSGRQGGVLPIVAPAGEPSVLPAPDAYKWFTETSKTLAPKWSNFVTIESVAQLIEYFPAAFIDLVAPKPLLIVAARGDAIIPIGQVEEAFARAGEPKQLEVYDCTHFDIYSVDPWHSRATASACEWFKRHL